MKKILLIEDDSNYIWHIKNFLQRKGYHVLVAFTVSQGKELIEKEQILIIGSDLKLSDGSGMELLEYLREKTYKIPFLFFTCYDKKYYEKEALEKGAKICMNKLQFDLVKETLLEYAYKESNGEGAKISTQSLRIMKLLHRKQGKIFTKSNEYYVRKISCAWGMPGFRIHSFRDYRRKIEMGITAGVQVPRIIPL